MSMPIAQDRAQALRSLVLEALRDGQPKAPQRLYGHVAQVAQATVGTVLHAQVRSAVLDLIGAGAVQLTNNNDFVQSSAKRTAQPLSKPEQRSE